MAFCRENMKGVGALWAADVPRPSMSDPVGLSQKYQNRVGVGLVPTLGQKDVAAQGRHLRGKKPV